METMPYKSYIPRAIFRANKKPADRSALLITIICTVFSREREKERTIK